MDGGIPPTRSTIPGGRLESPLLESPCRLCWALKKSVASPELEQKQSGDFPLQPVLLLLQG